MPDANSMMVTMLGDFAKGDRRVNRAIKATRCGLESAVQTSFTV